MCASLSHTCLGCLPDNLDMTNCTSAILILTWGTSVVYKRCLSLEILFVGCTGAHFCMALWVSNLLISLRFYQWYHVSSSCDPKFIINACGLKLSTVHLKRKVDDRKQGKWVRVACLPNSRPLARGFKLYKAIQNIREIELRDSRANTNNKICCFEVRATALHPRLTQKNFHYVHIGPSTRGPPLRNYNSTLVVHYSTLKYNHLYTRGKAQTQNSITSTQEG